MNSLKQKDMTERRAVISLHDLQKKEAKCGMFFKKKKQIEKYCVLILECSISFRCQGYFGKRKIVTGQT